MPDLPSSLTRWVTFAGGVLIVAVLYWAQAVLVPLAMAVLLTFLIAPAVSRIERHTGRAPAVVLVVLCTFTLLGSAGWVAARQLSSFADSLPAYRENIRQKAADVRALGRGGSVEKVQETLEELQREIEEPGAPGVPGQPVVVASQQVSSLWGFPAWVGPLVEPLSTAGFVVVLVIFMLMERQDLRDRLVGAVGYGFMASTTRAFDEAATRVSRYLFRQSIVNVTYGVAVAAGLWLLGVPYALLWGALGAVLRFIPYVGPLAAAAGPILVSLAALPGWERPLYVVGLLAALELFTNMVLETLLYAGAAGVSQVALLVAVGFWTWLWGPIGLLLATPLTVCLVVIGKHVPGLEFVTMLTADSPPLRPEMRYYQRVLAGDEGEAAEIIDAHVREHAAASVFDALMLPALNWAERDRLEGRLSPGEEAAVHGLTRELVQYAATLLAQQTAPPDGEGRVAVPREAWTRVVAYGVSGEADELALRMLNTLVGDLPIAVEVVSSRLLASELAADVSRRAVRIVCIADLPPSAPSKTRYLVRRLRASAPDVKIVVGRWAPADLADTSLDLLRQSGADFAASTLQETRDQLRLLSSHEAVTSPAA